MFQSGGSDTRGGVAISQLFGTRLIRNLEYCFWIFFLFPLSSQVSPEKLPKACQEVN